jgi:hypothetical protein
MNTMTCADLEQVADELALDVLDGEQRAAAFAHLEVCSACRHEVASLTETAQDVLLLAPVAEPSDLFEQRVLTRIARLGATDEPKRLRRRPTSARRVLAVAAAFVVIVAGALVVTNRSRDHEAAAMAAPVRTATGQVVGDASLRGGRGTAVLDIPGWIDLVNSYPGATVDAPYWLAVARDDGSRDLHRLPPADKQPWTVNVGREPGAIASVAIVDNAGTVWCTARFDSHAAH